MSSVCSKCWRLLVGCDADSRTSSCSTRSKAPTWTTTFACRRLWPSFTTRWKTRRGMSSSVSPRLLPRPLLRTRSSPRRRCFSGRSCGVTPSMPPLPTSTSATVASPNTSASSRSSCRPSTPTNSTTASSPTPSPFSAHSVTSAAPTLTASNRSWRVLPIPWLTLSAKRPGRCWQRTWASSSPKSLCPTTVSPLSATKTFRRVTEMCIPCDTTSLSSTRWTLTARRRNTSLTTPAMHMATTPSRMSKAGMCRAGTSKT
mmetsp:Transcript_12044/g.25798  ORF Transcript_12044/g.25798 Transcript_12044/m.25798 type:complete len:258 (-) Transcript_12044:1775-2548(-)